ncbi:hypothetical protein [Cellulomonas sp. GbtcB1]|jgi:hypothetical protein|uniref:hypothetical protein n=1 Tax=Cellulomonas sp. GbtcB1 TaxID=2824746 RepID=UPI001C30BFF1|nr:hypothetical protein [Cellulomonas sp. GbtcB1]
MPPRTTRMTPASARERAEIAREHLRVAEERLAACADGPSREASVSAANAISAAIAAADAICGIVLGHRSSGPDHRAAAALLAQVADGAPLARRLVRLTAQKSQAQYGDYVTARVARDVTASAARLVSALPQYGV